MACRHQSVPLMRQVRAIVQPRSLRRTFASSSWASSKESDAASASSSLSGYRASENEESRGDAQPAQRAHPMQEEGTAPAREVAESVQSPDPSAVPPTANDLAAPTTPKETSSTSQTKPTTAPTRTRRGKRESASSDLPRIRFDDKALSSFPPLLNRAHPAYDSADRAWITPTKEFPYGGSFSQYNNDRKRLSNGPGGEKANVLQGEDGDASTENESILKRVHLTAREYQNLHVHEVARRFPVQQTGNGKIQSQAILTVVGNGKGLVGFANEKHQEPDQATRRSFQQAIRSLEYIKRFEERTIHRTTVGRFSATTVHLRPRPPGFGLRCPPIIHAIARSAGISDLSASILGSTHPINVCRATLAALGSGSGPTGFGNGIGGPGRRIDRGEGAKTLEELEAERGRRFRVLQN